MSRALTIPDDGTTYTPDLDVFAHHYIIAALWSSVDNADDSGGSPLDDAKYDGRLTRKAREEMRRDCAEWIEKNAGLIRELAEVADSCGYGGHQDCGDTDPIAAACAHDLWLTRNGHGVGFWDRDLPKDLADRLTRAAEDAGTRDLYVSRGWIYQG